jgi:transmembrane sensor
MTTNNQRIDEQAAHWAIRLSSGPLSAEEQVTLDAWLEADARHPGALLRAQCAWLDLDRLGALAVGRRVVPSLSKLPLGRTSKRNRYLGLAASIAALIITFASVTWWYQARGTVYASDVGEIRRVTLEDGSNLVLNTATKAIVHFDETRRDVDLAQGEGLFEVAKDPNRPFTVRTESVSVRAVGTVFSVRAVDGRVDVTVTEGVVELVNNANPHHAIKRVAANEHATIEDVRKVDILPLKQDQAERRLAWQAGMVDFDGQPLIEAVSEINRHNHRTIVIVDPQLAERPVVGRFKANDPNNFAATVAIAFGAQVLEEGDTIRIFASTQIRAK